MNQQQFINLISPLAQADMRKNGILASLTMAQCILESGWGSSELSLKANNYFGIKGDYNGSTYKIVTTEFVNGKYIHIYADFKKYPTLSDSLNDHSSRFLTLDRYKALRGETDYRKACTAVYQAGYATAPDYATKLIKLIEKYKLNQYDKESVTNMSKTIICIDAGHCDKFTGAGKGNQREEKDTLKLALLVEKYLRSYGHTVCMTRCNGNYLDSRNKDTDLQARPAYANTVNADYFISLHRNSLTGSNATGNEIWVHSKANATTIKIAQCILTRVNSVAPLANRGVKKGYTGNPNADYAVNRLSKMASSLLELSFISNDKDNDIFNKNINKFAQAIAIGICEGMEITFNTSIINDSPVMPPIATMPTTYYLWVGKFKNKSDAIAASEKIKSMSYYNEVRQVEENKSFYYVWVGKFSKITDAEKASTKIKSFNWYNEIRKL